MINRTIIADINRSLGSFPAVILIGPRQCGKTTLVKNLILKDRETRYLDLEKPSDLNLLDDPEFFLREQRAKCVILDEIQRKPDLFPVIRSLIDEDRRPGRFVFLGSASPHLLSQSSESLAGRIVYHELTPFLLPEVARIDKEDAHWFRGGFPPAFLASTDGEAGRWTEAFISSYVERDLPLIGPSIPPARLRRFWTMLAHHHSGIWNASEFSRSLGVSSPTVSKYLDLLEGAFLIRRLRPWTDNIKKRTVKSPKVYLRDSGVLHPLLGIRSRDELLSRVQAGASWEGYVVEQTAGRLPHGIDLYFYRTADGTECDLVLTRADKPVLLVEIKLSASSVNTRSLTIAGTDLSCPQACVVVKEQVDDEIKPGIRLCGLSRFLELVANL